MANFREGFTDLITLGRRQGFLTYGQLNSHLPEQPEPTLLDRLLTLLEDEGIELTEDSAPADEREWLACTNIGLMLDALRATADGRKLRLFAAACCRRAWDLLRDPRCRQAVELAEPFADGDVTEEERRTGQERAEAVLRELRVRDTISTSKEFTFVSAAERAASRILSPDPGIAANAGRDIPWCLDFMGDAVAQALLEGQDVAEIALLRDIFGNPFRPVVLAPKWRTAAVVSLAAAAYDQRQLPSGHLDGERLAVLADALEDAGGDNREILEHLRAASPHVRGCWPIDLILNKQ